jgi:predicted Zn-dependent protease
MGATWFDFVRSVVSTEVKLREVVDSVDPSLDQTWSRFLYSDKTKQDLKVEQKLQHRIIELEKDYEKLEMQILSNKKIHELEKTNFVVMKKYYSIIAIVGIMMGGFVGAFTIYENSLDDGYALIVNEPVKSKYLVQNLRGDTLQTWIPWMLTGSQALYVNILDNDLATQERIDVIKNAIESEETLVIDYTVPYTTPKKTNPTYYKGWTGALLLAAQQNTQLNIPTNFEFSNSDLQLGDITIELLSLSDPDGYSGYTKSVVDQGEILKSHIIIYDVNSISNEQLSTTILHEFGHALGLAHSSDPDDLMYPVLETDFPYISECMIDGISRLYDGMKFGEVECQN